MRGQGRNEKFVPKHRLAGAAILIGFAVIILPMLLGGPDNGTGDADQGQLRSASSKQVFQSNIKPIGGEVPENRPAPESGAESGSKRPESPPPASEEEGEKREPVVTAVEEDDAVQGDDPGNDQGVDQGNEGAPAKQKTSAAGTESGGQDAAIERGWIVQVGTFKNPDNVKKLVDDLESSGFNSSTTDVDTSEGPATRVWVGPFETRVEAARIKTRVKQSTGSEGLIVAYP